jgi:1,4-dihydroxy-2-naphthoate octaprenyltransferase
MNINNWLIAFRLKTLWASISPVLASGVYAYTLGSREYITFILIVISALLIQISSNLINDYVDFKKGTDKKRVGPTRAMQAGLLTEKEIKLGIYTINLLALIIGVYLVKIGGLPILLIGLSGLLCAGWYSIGKVSLSYSGIAEIFVLIFFGPVATSGTFYLLKNEWNYEVFILGLTPGLISTAVLVANNVRDYESDKEANKKTLAVRFGKNFGKLEYCLLLLMAPILPILLSKNLLKEFIVVGLLLSPFILKNILKFKIAKEAHEFLPLLAETAKLLVLFVISFIIALFLF